MRFGSGVLGVMVLGAASIAAAQTQAPEGGANAPGWRKLEDSKPADAKAAGPTVPAGTRVLLTLINGVSTKHSVEGDRIYLQTSYPIVADSRIVIPAGSYVAGTLTFVHRPGRSKDRRGEIYLRFDSLTLPNGVTRDFRSRLGGLEGDSSAEMDRSEGKVKAASNKGDEARTVGETAAAGAGIGAIAGGVTGHPLTGLAVGSVSGAAVGLMEVLLSRGPDAVLSRGTTMEMVLDRPLTFEPGELDFSHAAPPMPIVPAASDQTQQRRTGLGWPL
ncbi:MAG TPA: hypothetical protein VN893_12155 [Bryobacteraceae bacterium]|nr:hypothetical protein [Bryobacteraceae bacterium]